MHFEWLIDLGEPFSPVRGPPAAAFVKRQLQLAQQAGDLFAGGDMTEARASAKGRLVDVVERGESAREKFAIDDTFGEPVDRAKAKSQR